MPVGAPDRDHPAVHVARAEKLALARYFADALRVGGAGEADAVAVQLTRLFDGASAYAVVHGGSTPATRQSRLHPAGRRRDVRAKPNGKPCGFGIMIVL